MVTKPRISSITVENVLGIERLEVRPGTVTVVSGRNGAGKTSFLEAIRSLMRGGHDASLLRRGAARGLVRFVREDGVELTKKITAERSPLDVRIPGAGKVSQGQAVVDSMVDELAIDPLALITAKPRDRAKFALDLIDVELPDEAIAEATGYPVPKFRGSALERIAIAREVLYDERTAVNRVAKENRSTVSRLRETLPSAEEEVPDLAALRAERAALASSLAEVENAAPAERVRCENAAANKRAESVEAIKTNAQAELDAIREDAAERIRAIERERDAALERVKDRAREEAEKRANEERLAVEGAAEGERIALEAAESAFGSRIPALDKAITQAEERAKALAWDEKTREILADAQAAAEKAEASSKALSAAIERLDALKVSLLARLPIPGLDARAEDLFLDGIPFERLNTAKQIEISVRLAALRAGNSGLVVVDHGEALDSASRSALKSAADACGIQLLVAVVSDGPLTVETLPTEAKAEAA